MNRSHTYHPVVILGGGIAGIATALELTRQGLPVALVEKTPFYGGRVAHLCCKATTACQKCGACLLEERLRELLAAPRLCLYPHTTLTAARRENGVFYLTFRRQPRIIDPLLCVDCGLCYEECPAVSQGALIQAASSLNHPRYAVIPENCLYFKDASCQVCQKVCPPTVKAIDLSRREELVTLPAAAVVIATGYTPADPCSRPYYGYGRFPQVLSGWEVEASLRSGRTITRADGAPLRRVAFIHCVGSRDHHHPYCSQVCCAYTLRLARLLKNHHPDLEIASFYMDLQNVGLDHIGFQADVSREIKVIRGLPGDVTSAPEGSVYLRFLEPETGTLKTDPFDLVILAVGMAPGPDNPELAALLGLKLSPAGFFQAADPQNRCLTSQPGVFLVGSAEGPKDISACVIQAAAAAKQVCRYLQRKS